MGYEKSLLAGIDSILEHETQEQIISFQRDLRENIKVSSKLSITALVATLTFIFSHYLLTNGQIEGSKIHIFTLKDSQNLRIALLFLSSGSLLITLLADFMWRCHRETYDCLFIKQQSKFTETGLHDFRVPPSYFGALDLLRNDGSSTSRWVSIAVRYVLSFVSFGFPTAYLHITIVEMLRETLASSSWFLSVVLVVALLTIFASFYVIWRSLRLSNASVVARG